MMPINDIQAINAAKQYYFDNIEDTDTKRMNIVIDVQNILKSYKSQKEIDTINSIPALSRIKNALIDSNNCESLLYDYVFISYNDMEKFKANISSMSQSHTVPLKIHKKLINRFKYIRDRHVYNKFPELLKINVCPYCNRILINTDRSFEMDHFFPKSEYPIFAVCFYNLIPTCKSCNNNKANTLPNFQNPYQADFNSNYIRFIPVINKMGEISLKTQINNTQKGYIDTLKLDKVYDKDLDYMKDQIARYRLFSEDHLQSIFKVLSPTNEEINYRQVRALILGRNITDSKINVRPYEKLDRDLYENLINNKI